MINILIVNFVRQKSFNDSIITESGTFLAENITKKRGANLCRKLKKLPVVEIIENISANMHRERG